jgi:cell wall-associated NlpC family hydrolase
MTTDDIIAAARSAIGIPFRHQGRTERGLDCAGLIIHVAKKLEIVYVDSDGYARQPSGGLLESMLDAQPCLERVADMQAGDVLLMRFAGEPQHLGIFTGQNIIHSWAQPGKVCEHGFIAPWPKRVVRIYRFKGLNHE